MSSNSNRPLSEIFENRSLFVLRLGQIVLTTGFLIAGVILTYWIMNTEGNPIAFAMVILGPICMVISVVQPLVGMRILVVACCYLDLVKRIAYYFGYYSAAGQGTETLQLYVLALAPLTLVGLFIGVIIRRIFGSKQLIQKGEAGIAVFVVVANALILISNFMATKDLKETLSKGANEGVYLLLLFVVPSLYSSRAEIIPVLRWIFWVFLGCAFYGIWQGIVGYTQLDLTWMASGITLTEGLLSDVKARAFGTLASPHPYGVLYWLILIGIYLAWISENKRVFYTVGTAIYAFALFFGYGRGAWAALILTLFAYFFFKTRPRIILFYSGAVSIFLGFALNAQYLLDHLDDFQTVVPIESKTGEMAFRLGTFSERLWGIQNWTSSTRLWSWFGRPDLKDYTRLRYDEITHEMLGQLLVRYGAVGLFGALLSGAAALFYFHRTTLSIENRRDRQLATLLLAMISVNFYLATMTGASYEVFPWNFFIWLIIAFLLVLCRNRSVATSEVATAERTPAELSAVPKWQPSPIPPTGGRRAW